MIRLYVFFFIANNNFSDVEQFLYMIGLYSSSEMQICELKGSVGQVEKKRGMKFCKSGICVSVI